MDFQSLQNDLKDWLQKQAASISSTASRVADNVITKPVEKFFTPDPKSGVRVRDVIREIPNVSVGESILNVPKFDLGKNKTGLKGLVGDIASGFLNPFVSIKDYTKEAANQYYGVAPANTKKLIGLAGGAALDLGGLAMGGAKGAQFAKEAMSKVAPQSIKQLSKVVAKNAWQGSKIAGKFGAGYGVSDAMANDDNLLEILKGGAQGYAAGRVLGAGLGFAGGAGPALVKAGVGSVAGKMFSTASKYPYFSKTVSQLSKAVPEFSKDLPRPGFTIEDVSKKVVKRGKQLLTDAGAEIEHAKLYQKNLIETAAKELKAMEESLKGGQTVDRMPGEVGYESYGGSMNLKRISEHSAEYRDYFKKNGKKPPLSFYRDQIMKGIKRGTNEIADEFNAVQDYIDSFGNAAMKEAAPIKEKVLKEISPKAVRMRFTTAINKAKNQQDAIKNINDLVDRIMNQGGEELVGEAKKAINAQLNRFQRFRGNEKAGSFFTALEDNFNKLADVPFGASGMFKRLDSPSLKKDFENFYSMKKESGAPTVITHPELANISEKISDINPMRSAFSDVYRNFQKAFGENFQLAKEKILDPFDQAKANFISDQENLLNELQTNVVDNLGITKGSKLSRYVQQFGEGKLTLGELQQLEPKKWEAVVEADKWFRGMYDALLNQVNKVRAEIYPNNPEKIIPAREDYYRHFMDMAEGFSGLKNIFESPSSIQSSLAGVSEATKPKARWASFMQARTGDKTKYDAVGGFLDYIKAATYSKNIDPMIEQFRGLANDLRSTTAEEGGRLNNFIIFLDDFANDLAGKTNKLDRAIQDWIPGTRKTMAAMNWVNNRFKVNAIVGNVSSAVNQTLQLPVGVADAGVGNTLKAIPDTLANIFKETASRESKFLKERYFSSAYDAFDTGFVDNAKNGAAWLLRNIEETTTRFIWNSEYQKALSQGVENPIKTADEWTRSVVAGRGVGEVPLAQKSKVFQMLLPFQLEVTNMWEVFKDWTDAKTFGKIMSFAVASNLLNSAIQSVSGQRPGFDPLSALSAGLENSLNDSEGGRNIMPLAGEVLSNIPGGGYLSRAVLTPEQSKKIFGEQFDPAKFDRYGSGIPMATAVKPATNIVGSLLSGNGIKGSDVAQVIEYFGLPFGGGQVKKTLAGMSAIANGGRYDSKGGLQYPTDKDITDKLSALVYGPSAMDSAQFFFDNNLSSLTEKETAAWKAGVQEGKDPIKLWVEIQKGKITRGLRDRIRGTMREDGMDLEEKKAKVSQITQGYNRLMEKLNNYTQGL